MSHPQQCSDEDETVCHRGSSHGGDDRPRHRGRGQVGTWRPVEGHAAHDEADQAAHHQKAMSGQVRFEHDHGYPEYHQGDAQDVQRQAAGPVEGKHKGKCAEQAHDQRRVEELDRDAQDPDHEQDEGYVRIVQPVQNRLDEILTHSDSRRALRVDDHLCAVHGHDLAIGLAENLIEAIGDAIDAVGCHCLLSRIGLGIRNRGGSPIDGQRVAQLGDAAHGGHGVAQDFVGLGLAVGGGQVPTACGYRRGGPDIRAVGHVGEARRQGDKRSGAGRFGARWPDPNDRRDRGVLEELVDCLHRALAAAQCVELNHDGRGAVRLSLPNSRGDVARHDVVDNTAGRQDHDLRSGRRTCRRRLPRRGHGLNDLGGRPACPSLANREQKPERHGQGRRNARGPVRSASGPAPTRVDRAKPTQNAAPRSLGLDGPR